MLSARCSTPIDFTFDKWPEAGAVFILEGDPVFRLGDVPLPFPTTSSYSEPAFKWLAEVKPSERKASYLLLGRHYWTQDGRNDYDVYMFVEIDLEKRLVGNDLLIVQTKYTNHNVKEPNFHYVCSLTFEVALSVNFSDRGEPVHSNLHQVRCQLKQ